jgi:Protein of unknown function (DUF4242)
MHRYVIERELPAIGSADREKLRAAAQKSNETLAGLGPQIQWVESFVAADKTFCVYLAENEDIIREHAKRSGFPANKITEVRRMIDPTTAHA